MSEDKEPMKQAGHKASDSSVEKRGGWQTLSRKRIYANPWIVLEEHQVINPGGGRGIYGVIHYENIAIGIIPVDSDGNTWLVGQHRYPKDEYSWEIPSGGGLHRDAPLESAKRELKEETGIGAEKWELIQRYDLSNSTSDEYALIYLATGLRFGPSSPSEDEDLQVRKLSLEEAFAEVRDGSIQDSLSVIGLQRLELMIRDGWSWRD